MVAKSVIVEGGEFLRSWPVNPKGHLLVQFADVAERGAVSVYLIKVVDLLRNFFGCITATFFVAHEPKSSPPRPVAIKIIDPVGERFLFNQHKRKDNKRATKMSLLQGLLFTFIKF